LSRAGLGETIIIIYKWLKKTVFLPGSGSPCTPAHPAEERNKEEGKKIEASIVYI
jgi:hypothetical protein